MLNKKPCPMCGHRFLQNLYAQIRPTKAKLTTRVTRLWCSNCDHIEFPHNDEVEKNEKVNKEVPSR